jgi:hypothetical protein
MQHSSYAARLRYLDAKDVDDSYVDFDGLDVRGRDDDRLGDTDGFIVNADTGRVFYIVVDSGGWFRSRRFLLPVGHATVDRDAGAIRVDVRKDLLERYPEFDQDRFLKFSDDDMQAFERRMSEACCPDELLQDVSVAPAYFETRRHYTQPAWWGVPAASRERFGPVDTAGSRAVPPAAQAYDREHVTAREIDVRRGEIGPDDETRRGADVSPHYEGRAQPGDVLGLETGGERTSIGETAEDENERRRTAERTARRERDEEEPRRSER